MNAVQQSSFAAAVFACSILGLTFLLGRWSAPPAAPVALARPPRPRPERTEDAPSPPPPAAVCEHGQASAAETGSTDPERELATRLLIDPAPRSAALEDFRRQRDPAELERLVAELGQVHDLEVEDLALELARDETCPPRRLAALGLLDALDTPRALEVALEILRNPNAIEIRRAAIYVLPEAAGSSFARAREVVAVLKAAYADPSDAELRRRAAIALADWRVDPEDLDPLLRGLRSDPSVDVRAGCAFALELAGGRDQRTIETLAAALQDRREDPLVRENAWRALARLGPLPEAIAQAWESYADELAARTEVPAPLLQEACGDGNG